MGAVYAASNDAGAPFAIKFLHEKWCDVPEIVTRFTREAKNALRVDSEFVARVMSIGRSGSVFWIAYERFPGETLHTRMVRDRVLAGPVARTIVEELLRGLDAAHAIGVIHRDIKPENVFLESRREPPHVRTRILDFGVSKYRAAGDTTTEQPLTSANQTLGTISYMPPEQMSGAARVDGRADLYAAGVVAFHMLSGFLPFAGRSPAVVIHEKLRGAPRTLAQVTGVAWPKPFEAFFVKTLARELDDRFATAKSMREAWTHALTACRERLPEPATFAIAPPTPDPQEPTDIDGSSSLLADNGAVTSDPASVRAVRGG
jgi:serine/threonine-protein kinase